ncbi:unnamed protein product, partial [Iphiclides podalirius]
MFPTSFHINQDTLEGSSFSDSSLRKPEFSLRIVVCDHYLTKPIPSVDVIYSEFRGSDIKQVPVLRVFGPTPDGRKACLHIHGVFPYFYLPCPTSNPEPQFLYQIAASLDKAINIALKQASSINQHVYKISLVKGLPFYGFHDKEHLYLKIFLYNPDDTIVDEDIALNSSFSLQYSQVLLDTEDLELVGMLQDMDAKPIDEDSVMGTPAESEEISSDVELDKEYSQIFDNDAIYLDPEKCDNDTNECTSSWNDSFWDGASIPQLDGTCDDEHIKKNRKRKIRAFKLGLSKPKNKKDVKANASNKCTKTLQSEMDINEIENSDSSGDSSMSIKKCTLGGYLMT